MYRGDARASRNQRVSFAATIFSLGYYVSNFVAFFHTQVWELKSNEAADEIDMALTPWLKAFVEAVGFKKAQKLLANAGDFTH